MSDWNEAKLETLEDAYSIGEISSSDLADSQGVTLHAASTRLKRYHRQGLFTREKIGKKYVYDLTGKGIARIDWLREKNVTEELFQTVAAKRCPVKKAKKGVPEDVQEPSYSNSEMTLDSMIWNYYSDKRCPVVRPRNLETQDSIDLDEEDEEEYEDSETYDLDQEDELDDYSSLFKNIQRCKVIREEHDPILSQDFEEEEEDVEAILKRLSQQRCKVNNDDTD